MATNHNVTSLPLPAVVHSSITGMNKHHVVNGGGQVNHASPVSATMATHFTINAAGAPSPVKITVPTGVASAQMLGTSGMNQAVVAQSLRFTPEVNSSVVVTAVQPNLHGSHLGGVQPVIANSPQKVKVEDALNYLDRVKSQFGSSSVYNDFLEIMKQFKSQLIDTSIVIQRVSELFKGHGSLITGFNAFLPPGYRIYYNNGNVQVVTPADTAPISIVATPSPSDATLTPSNPPGHGVRPNALPFLNHPPQKPQMQVITPHLSPAPGNSKLVSTAVNSVKGRAAKLKETKNSDNTTVSGLIKTEEQTSAEFDRAVNFVNRIKERFADEPGVYDSFLEILKYYKDQDLGTEKMPLIGKDLYEKVSSLFKNDKDLMAEFANFLPDMMSGMLAGQKKRPQSSGQMRSQNPEFTQTTVRENRPPVKHSRRRTQSNEFESPTSRFSSNSLIASRDLLNPGVVHEMVSDIPRKKIKTVEQSDRVNLVNTRSEFAMFDEIRNMLRARTDNESAYNDFIKCMYMLNNKIITKKEFIRMILPLIQLSEDQNCSVAFDWLVQFLGLKSSDAEHKITGDRFPLRTHQMRLTDKDNELESNDDGESTDEFEEELPPTCKNVDLKLRKTSNGHLPTLGRPKTKTENNSKENSIAPKMSKAAKMEEEPVATLCNNSEVKVEFVFEPLDLYALPKHGTSYRVLPKEETEASSFNSVKLEPAILECINTQYRSVSSAAEQSSYVPASSRKRYSQDYMSRIDDERFELDLMMDVNSAAIKSIEALQKAVSKTSGAAGDLKSVELRNVLSSVSTANLKSALVRLYGDRFPEILESLFTTPKSSLSVVKSRLRNRQDHWEQRKKEFTKVWNSLYSKHALRALDLRSSSYKQSDLRNTKSKKLINDAEQARMSEESGVDYLPSAITVRCLEDDRPWTPHLKLKYESSQAIRDADRLVIYYLKRNVSSRAEKWRMKRLLRHFLKDLTSLERAEMSDDELGVDEGSEFGDEMMSSGTFEDGGNRPKESGTNNGLTNYTTISAMTSSMACSSYIRDESSSVNAPPFPFALISFLCTNNWYLFFRLHIMLANKLATLYSRCEAAVESQKNATAVDANRGSESMDKKRGVAISLELKKPQKTFSGAEEVYEELLDAICDRMDNKIDSNQLEDLVRARLGLNAYGVFTIDKFIHATARQLQLIVSNQDNVSCLNLFLEMNQILIRSKWREESKRQLEQQYAVQLAEKVGKHCNIFRLVFEEGDNCVGLNVRLEMSEQDLQQSDFCDLTWNDVVKNQLPKDIQLLFNQAVMPSDSDENPVKRKALFLPRMIARGLDSEELDNWGEKRVVYISDKNKVTEMKTNESCNMVDMQHPFLCYRRGRNRSDRNALEMSWREIRRSKFKQFVLRSRAAALQENKVNVFSCDESVTSLVSSTDGPSIHPLEPDYPNNHSDIIATHSSTARSEFTNSQHIESGCVDDTGGNDVHTIGV